jgi:N-acetylneuraminic acid mutarotase
METMPRTRVCRKCGAELPPSGLEGLCPACVAHVAFVGEPDLDAVPLRDLTSARLRYFGDYDLLQEIARGGMGVVYKARQISLNRVVAVKMILAGQLASPADIQRFLAEAEAAANLQHPNIVAIHEIGQHEGQHYFSMDFVEGKNLAEIAGQCRTSSVEGARRATGYVKTIAEAIEYAHQQGTLHRDLKPSNILIDQFNQPRITDFGLAKRVKSDSDLTISGQIIGSPNFMPPEQAAGRRSEISPCSDIYSLGALLYFLLTGKPPFQGETIHDTLAQVLNAEPKSPRGLNPAIPRDLDTICVKCLEKSPARRYASAKALADDLARYLRGEPVMARPISRPQKLLRMAGRHRLTASLGLALLVLLVWVAVLASRRAVSPLGSTANLPPIAPMPRNAAQGVSAVIDGKFYVTSATAGISHQFPRFLFVYYPEANHWERLADSQVTHSCPAGGAIGGKFYVAGGEDGTNGVTPAVEAYDPVSRRWSFKRPMLTPRQACASVILSNKLFAIGGVANTGRVGTVEAYDTATDTWTAQPSLRIPRVGCVAAVIKDTIFVAGGVTNDPGACTDEVEVWKPGQTNWSVLEMQANIKMLEPAAQPFAAELGGVLYVFGGTTEIGAVDRSRCLVRADGGWTWTLQKEMPAIRYMGCGAVAYRDEIWLFGGWTMLPDSDALPHPDVFVFNPKGNSWRSSVSPDAKSVTSTKK